MNCRKFHRNLDDYLDDGLDFSGRFGIERHAQQCALCGRVMSEAQRLRRMAHQLERVKAPEDFESLLMHEIGRRKALGRFSGFRRLWFYGLGMPSPRRMIVASSCLAVIALGVFFMYPSLIHREASEPPPTLAQESVRIDREEILQPAIATAITQPKGRVNADVTGIDKAPEPSSPEIEQMADQNAFETDYVEFQVVGPDNRPVSFRWPNKFRTRYGQTSEENFIRNVSH